MCVQSVTPRHCDITHQWCNVNVAPGRWWQPYKPVRWWQKQLVRVIQTCWCLFGVFPRHLSNISTMCWSPFWKHPWAPTLLLFLPHVDVVFRLGRSGLIWTDVKVFSTFLWNHNSVTKVVPPDACSSWSHPKLAINVTRGLITPLSIHPSIHPSSNVGNLLFVLKWHQAVEAHRYIHPWYIQANVVCFFPENSHMTWAWPIREGLVITAHTTQSESEHWCPCQRFTNTSISAYPQ